MKKTIHPLDTFASNFKQRCVTLLKIRKSCLFQGRSFFSFPKCCLHELNGLRSDTNRYLLIPYSHKFLNLYDSMRIVKTIDFSFFIFDFSLKKKNQCLRITKSEKKKHFFFCRLWNWKSFLKLIACCLAIKSI